MGRNGLIQNGLVRSLAIHKNAPPAYSAISTASFWINIGFSLVSNIILWCSAEWLAQQYQAPQLLLLFPVYFITNFAMAPYMHCAYVQQANFEFRGIFWGTFFLPGRTFCLDRGLLVEWAAHYFAGIGGIHTHRGLSGRCGELVLRPAVPVFFSRHSFSMG